MTSSYEHRIIVAALRFEAADRMNDTDAMRRAVADVLDSARALRHERKSGSASRVEPDDEGGDAA
jgi:hypothetical protein